MAFRRRTPGHRALYFTCVSSTARVSLTALLRTSTAVTPAPEPYALRVVVSFSASFDAAVLHSSLTLTHSLATVAPASPNSRFRIVFASTLPSKLHSAGIDVTPVDVFVPTRRRTHLLRGINSPSSIEPACRRFEAAAHSSQTNAPAGAGRFDDATRARHLFLKNEVTHPTKAFESAHQARMRVRFRWHRI
ncbi:hypothetical protein SCHPADRAFT_934151, partial [Schizopora paradoxa]